MGENRRQTAFSAGFARSGGFTVLQFESTLTSHAETEPDAGKFDKLGKFD